MGSAQALPIGNWLVAESMAGRVFEIDAEGEIVWEYILPYDDIHGSIIESALRYDRDYFRDVDWTCPS